MSLRMSFTAIKADDTKSPSEKLYAMTREAMLENGSDDFSACFARVCEAEPELHREYLDSNGKY